MRTGFSDVNILRGNEWSNKAGKLLDRDGASQVPSPLRAFLWATFFAVICASPIVALSAVAQEEYQSTTNPLSQESGAEAELSDDERKKRNRQDIDEPNLAPMFGPRRLDDDINTEDDPDRSFDEDDGKVERLRGFTGILTFLAPEQTDLSIGVGPVIQPDYFGSDNYTVEADPQVFIKLRNFIFFDDDGADLALFGFSNFRAGPSIRIVGDRDEDENPALVGLGDVGTTFELGGFAAATFVDRYTVKFKVRQGIETGHRGLIVDAFGTILLFKYGRFSSSVSAQASWIGDKYADTFFTVTPEQSAASGLREFEAAAGFRNIGGSMNGYINLGQRWSLNPYVSYNRIIGNIRNTPIIADRGSPDQFRAGFHIIRQFTLFN